MVAKEVDASGYQGFFVLLWVEKNLLCRELNLDGKTLKVLAQLLKPGAN